LRWRFFWGKSTSLSLHACLVMRREFHAYMYRLQFISCGCPFWPDSNHILIQGVTMT
jgi:hypothetical protein